MSKIGVGIGEDFPADDTRPGEAPREDDHGDTQHDRRDYGHSDAEYAARREAWRQWREQRSEWKRQWRARKRAFRSQMQGSFSENHRGYRHPIYGGHGIVWGVLALIGVIALISFAFSHIFLIVGVIALLALFAAYHRGYDPFDLPSRDYSKTTQSPPAPQPPSDAAH